MVRKEGVTGGEKGRTQSGSSGEAPCFAASIIAPSGSDSANFASATATRAAATSAALTASAAERPPPAAPLAAPRCEPTSNERRHLDTGVGRTRDERLRGRLGEG